MAKKGQTYKVYTEKEKMEAVRLYESGVSSREVARKLGIPEKNRCWTGLKRSVMERHLHLHDQIKLGEKGVQKPSLQALRKS